MLDYPPKFGPKGIRLAFYGPMASGKTTMATSIFTEYHKELLAGPLKETAKEYYGVTGKTNEERKILQELADDLKKWDDNVFTKRLLWRLHNYYSSGLGLVSPLPVVIDDVRFKHEADDLRDYGFEIIRVSVPEDIRLARIAEKYPDTDPARFTHRSETDLENIKEDTRVTGHGSGGINFLRAIYGQSIL